MSANNDNPYSASGILVSGDPEALNDDHHQHPDAHGNSLSRKRRYIRIISIIAVTCFVLGVCFGEGPANPVRALFETLVITAGGVLLGLFVIVVFALGRRLVQRMQA